jgi:lipopolysaccharide biosynthesis glycosyltransferase
VVIITDENYQIAGEISIYSVTAVNKSDELFVRGAFTLLYEVLTD